MPPAPSAPRYASCHDATRAYVLGGGVAQAPSLNVSSSAVAAVACPHAATRCCIGGNTDPLYACLRAADAPREQPCSKHAVQGRNSGVRLG